MKLSTCHPNRKVQARGLCKNCYDKWLKENNPLYKRDQIINSTKWQKLNPERRKELNKIRREKELLDPDLKIKKRDRMLRKKYGITIEDYNKIFDNQNESCALCFRKPGKFPLHVDHSHKTGKVRGLLCHQCNWYLGTIDEDPSIIDRIIAYLKVEQ